MAEEKKKADEQACEPEKKDKKPSEAKEEKKAKHDYKKECASLKEELASTKDSYLRLAAEYDNFRRRSQQERENVYADAYADALKVLLPTADNLERALKFADGDPAKIVEGVAPDDNVTREQTVTILMRYASCKGSDVSRRADLSKYTDADKIHSYAREAFSWANAEGIIRGMSATTLSPLTSSTRAQTAEMLRLFCAAYSYR